LLWLRLDRMFAETIHYRGHALRDPMESANVMFRDEEGEEGMTLGVLRRTHRSRPSS
jgi:hypothetical protein